MAGYSGKSLGQKLGLKAGMRMVFLGMPAEVRAALDPLPEGVVVLQALRKEAGGMDYVHYFAQTAVELEKTMGALKGALKKDGMLWVSWRKGMKAFTENDVRRVALATGLVDVKVCAVDEAWSGLKLVYRVKDRA